MLKEEIVVGKSYVNEGACIIREVIEEVDRRHLRYNAFELESGKLLPARHCVCSTADLRQWADRESTPNETARTHPFELDTPVGGVPGTQRGVLHLDEARSALAGALGTHTFPRIK